MQPGDLAVRKSYERPMLRSLTSNQAALFLVGYAHIGDRGAKELLELLFPKPTDPQPPSARQHQHF